MQLFAADGHSQLEGLLLAHFKLSRPLTFTPELRGKAARGTHVVATDAAGVRVGLKYVSAHFSDPVTKWNLLPTENVVACRSQAGMLFGSRLHSATQLWTRRVTAAIALWADRHARLMRCHCPGASAGLCDKCSPNRGGPNH